MAAQRMGLIEAKERYETALRLWGQGDDAGRLALLMKLGQAALTGGDPSAARAAFVEAADGWQDIREFRRAGAALATLGRVLWVTGEIDRAADALQRAIEVLEPEGSSPELVQAFVWRSTQLMLDGQTEQSASIAERGLRMAEELGLDDARSHLLNNLGVCDGYSGEAGGIDRLRQALELAERAGDAEAIGRAFINLPETMESYGKHTEAIELNRIGRERLRRLGALAYETFVAGNEARALAMVGRYEEAERLGREALAHERAMRTPPGIVNAVGGLLITLIRRGRLEEARALRDEVAPLARRVGGADFLGRFLIWEAELEEALGNAAAARQVMDEALSLVFSRPVVLHQVDALPTAARLLPGDRIAGLLERVRSQVRHPALEAPLRAAEATLTGDPAIFLRAADLYADLRLPYEEAQCRLGAGDLDRARELIGRYGLADGPMGARLREITT
jgi:tetratricopeptide (TPR) repeat protein